MRKEPNFIFYIYVNGELFELVTGDDDYNWEEFDRERDIALDYYGSGYKEISGSTSGSDGYSVQFNEKLCKSFCVSWKGKERTPFKDINGNTVWVDDELVSNGVTYRIHSHCRLMSNERRFYIRTYEGCRFNTWKDYEITNQEELDRYEFEIKK